MRITAGPFCDQRQLSALDALIGAEPSELRFRFGRACCLEDLGRTHEAIAAYVEVLGRAPGHLGALTNLGSLLLERGRVTEAAPYLERAASAYPSDPVACANLARLDAARGAVVAAIAGYEALLATRPGSLHAHLGLAALYAETGRPERARLHRERAYAQPRLWQYPYRGAQPPLRVLVLASAGGGDIAANLFFDDDVVEKTVLLADSARDAGDLPRHHVLFNAIGDADRCAPSLYSAAAIRAASHAPAINEPTAVARTGRVEVARRLALLDGLRAPRIALFARERVTAIDLRAAGFTFPLLLRSPGHHAGMYFERVERPDELAAALDRLPGTSLLAIEYLDARGAGGYVRKYRCIAVDGVLYPLHLAVGEHWKLHYFSAGMAEDADHRAEEAAFLDDMPAVVGARAMHALAAIRDVLGLDYCGIDFGLDAAGNVLVFEANATMAVYLPEGDAIWDYRRPAADRIVQAVRAMLVARARQAGYG